MEWYTTVYENGYLNRMPWAAGCCIGLGLFLTQANVFFKDTRTVTMARLCLTPISCPPEALPEMAI